METKAFTIDVNVTARSQPRLVGIVSTVVITLYREFEEFIVNENGGLVTSLGFSPASFSSPSNPKIFLQLETFKPDYVDQILRGRLHDHVLSQKVSDAIVAEAQRRISQSYKQPLFMEVFVILTQKVFNVVPCFSPHLDQKSEEEPVTTCAICLEDMSGGSEDNYQIPNCSHWFHIKCFLEWLSRNNSCPLCRQPVYQKPK